MFIREVNPFHMEPINEENDRKLIKHLEDKFKNQKLCAIAMVSDYFIFLEFEEFCRASMLVQNKFMERLKNSE